MSEYTADAPVVFEPGDEALDSWKEWSEGTESVRNHTRSDFMNMLGVPVLLNKNGEIIRAPDGEKRYALPYMNQYLDKHREWTPWTHPDEFEDAEKHLDRLEHMELRWHQSAGLLCMMRNAFDGKNMLVMDDVGYGKTLLNFALCCLLRYYAEEKERSGKYPGIFGELFHILLGRRLLNIGLLANRTFGVPEDLSPAGASDSETPELDAPTSSRKRPGNSRAREQTRRSGKPSRSPPDSESAPDDKTTAAPNDQDEHRIPDEPIIWCGPKSIVPQYYSEAKRFLEPKANDLVPFEGPYDFEKREGFHKISKISQHTRGLWIIAEQSVRTLAY